MIAKVRELRTLEQNNKTLTKFGDKEGSRRNKLRDIAKGFIQAGVTDPAALKDLTNRQFLANRPRLERKQSQSFGAVPTIDAQTGARALLSRRGVNGSSTKEQAEKQAQQDAKDTAANTKVMADVLSELNIGIE